MLRALAPDAARFEPFGAFITAPEQEGTRRMFGEWLTPVAGLMLQMHTNLVPASALPVAIEAVERHPHGAQAFLPLDAGRYLVVVMPATPTGGPDPAGGQAFVLPPTMGVVYRRGVWHASITALDRRASFAVLMWRGAPVDDLTADVSTILIEL